MPTPRRAYAKVNLALSVGAALPPGGPNAGMHPIASWMHAIDLFDDVELGVLAAGPSLHEIGWTADAARAGPIDWPLEKDLGVRAHRLMERHAGRELPVRMRIGKRIPVGGGLGGGSSDAAAVMRAINEAFGLSVPVSRLARWSSELGSDVAYFLDETDPPRPAVVTGLGDRADRTGRAPGWVVLVAPAFGCATGAVYRAFDAGPRKEPDEARIRALAAGAMEALFNDLTAAAVATEPRLGDLIGRVRAAAQGPVHMSGSGSTLFVPAADEGESRVISQKVRAGVPDVTVVGVRLV